MKISGQLTDEAILKETGERLARRRLDMQLTQAELAAQAGIAKRTLERIEAGGSSQMSNVLRILRVLELLAGLDVFIPQTEPRPLELLRHKGKVRKRVSKSRRKTTSGAEESKAWTWGEDK